MEDWKKKAREVIERIGQIVLGKQQQIEEMMIL